MVFSWIYYSSRNKSYHHICFTNSEVLYLVDEFITLDFILGTCSLFVIVNHLAHYFQILWEINAHPRLLWFVGIVAVSTFSNYHLLQYIIVWATLLIYFQCKINCNFGVFNFITKVIFSKNVSILSVAQIGQWIYWSRW